MSEEQKLLQDVPRVNPVFQAIARFMIWAMGWKLQGLPPDRAKMVMIGGPHTANMDVFLMVMMAWKLGLKISYLVGDDIPFPLNKLSVWSNGIQIDRNHPNNNTVQQVVEYMNTVDRCALMIAPEGRLKKVKYWGSGFYYIALGANLPIVPAYLDYERKLVTIADEFHPTGDIEADMDKIREIFAPGVARFPEKVGPVQVRPRTKKMQQRLRDRHNGDSIGTTPKAPEKNAAERRR